ncbi:hypothetical protein BDM02DRAFT_3270763 [Thelephora ganbajun]|uniref:Uncharacterized protein n=1 Tax=Thelephora ganbajun TaxID=370292 RepID=A0ACB6ZAF6_THEGA|nr:hypothetical protein BDM02DRAFT_3270763 [Thelephora ganbajun]
MIVPSVNHPRGGQLSLSIKVFVLPVPTSKPSSNQELASLSNPDDVYIIRGLDQFPLHTIFGIVTRRIRIVISRGPQGAWGDRWLAGWNLNAFAQLGYFVVTVPHLVRLPLDKTSRMASRKVGEESRVPISESDGNISSITIFGCGPWPLEFSWVLASPPQIDTDCTAAAGSRYGGYAIKYFFASIPRDRDKDVSSWIQSDPGFGFGLKVLVCHDGVLDSQHHGILDR